MSKTNAPATPAAPETAPALDLVEVLCLSKNLPWAPVIDCKRTDDLGNKLTGDRGLEFKERVVIERHIAELMVDKEQAEIL